MEIVPLECQWQYEDSAFSGQPHQNVNIYLCSLFSYVNFVNSSVKQDLLLLQLGFFSTFTRSEGKGRVRVTVVVVVAVEPPVERPRAAEAAVPVERPPPPQPRAVPPLAVEPAVVPPAVAAETTSVEFEEVGSFVDVQIQGAHMSCASQLCV